MFDGRAHGLRLNNQVLRMGKEGHALGAYLHARREGIPKILVVIHGILIKTFLTQGVECAAASRLSTGGPG